MDLDKANTKLCKLDGGSSQFDGYQTGTRQRQEYVAEHWNELAGLCRDLIEHLEHKQKNKKPAHDSDRIHGEAFAAGISGVCGDCEAYADLEAENDKLKEIASLALDIHTRDPLVVSAKWGFTGPKAEELLVAKIEALKG